MLDTALACDEDKLKSWLDDRVDGQQHKAKGHTLKHHLAKT